MNLEIWENFEKLDLWKKVDYIFEKFWDTDYAADRIIDILNQQISSEWRKYEFAMAYHYNMEIKNILMNKILNKKEDANSKLDTRFYQIIDKFWRWPVALRLHLFILENVNWENWDIEVENLIWYFRYENITQNTLKCFAKWTVWARKILWRSMLMNCCEDWSISDRNIISYIVDNYNVNFRKLTPEWQKYAVALNPRLAFVRNNRYDAVTIRSDINFWEDIDIKDYVLNSLVNYEINKINPDYYSLLEYQKYHKEIADILIKEWKIDIVKKYISKFTWLSETEKGEIMWNTELENKLNKEKFDADLTKLQELWEKLWIIVKIEEKKQKEKNEKEDENVENKKSWWKSIFWRKWKK